MTAIFTHPDFQLHETPPHHPESPVRVARVSQFLEDSGLLSQVETIVPNLASTEELARVHDKNLVDQLALLSPKNWIGSY